MGMARSYKRSVDIQLHLIGGTRMKLRARAETTWGRAAVPSSLHVPRPPLRCGLLLYLRLEGTPTRLHGFRRGPSKSDAASPHFPQAEPRRGREAFSRK